MIPTQAFPGILDSLVTGLLLIDKKQNVVFANHSAEEIFRQSAPRLCQKNIGDLLYHDNLDADRIAKHQASDNAFQLHNVNVVNGHDDDTSCTLSFRLCPIEGVTYSLVEIYDLSLNKKLNEEYHRHNQHEATTDLLRRLAHEIKNPLSGLRGSAQLLKLELDDSELFEYTDIIIREADRLRNLVDRMLGPHAVEEKRLVNIHQVLEQARQVIEVDLPREVFINRDYDPSLPDILIAPEQLQQAVLNLLKNGVEAVGKSGEVTIRTRAQNQLTINNIQYRLALRIDIIDDGPGIDANLKNKIFFPLVSGKLKGTGLGLNIAQTLVQQHEGAIECESRPSETKFSILLPIVRQGS